MASIQKGIFEVFNPYSQKVSVVPAAAEQVHSIVFWSKDFGAFLDEGYGDRLARMGYRFFFNFTINSAEPTLEPNVPPLKDRLDQLTKLCERYDPQSVQWRFDPICHMSYPDNRTTDNLADFTAIARHAAEMGVSTCITSFVDIYRKVHLRMKHHPGIDFFDPPMARKLDVVLKLEKVLAALGMALALCCEKQVIEALPPESTVKAAACIPNHRLADLYGPDISLSRDHGQRKAAGCGCSISRDIGSYRLHPCLHDCLFCYANPSCDGQPRTISP